MRTLVDSSVWFAAVAKGDRNNELAKSILTSIRSPLLTDHVLSETWLLLKAFGNGTGDLFWQRLREAGIRPEPTNDADVELAWQIGEHFPKAGFSFVDRTSFAFMELRGISEVATFADSFGKYRYGPHRKRAFRIIATGHSTAFSVLSRAARDRKPVQLTYKGNGQTVCPHIVGETTGEERALVVLMDRSGKSRSTSQWACLRLSEVKDARLLDQPWVRADYPRRTQRCVDTVHVDANRVGDY